MKSYVLYLQGLYTSIFSQIGEYDPHLRLDCERDLSRLLSLVNSRGLSYLTIDLAEAGKQFDKSLAAGRLLSFGYPGFRAFRRKGTIPRLFKGMFQRVFDDDGVLRVAPDTAVIRFLRQLFYAAKKVRLTCSDSRTWEQVHEFFEVDLQVRPPSLDWDSDAVLKTTDRDSVDLVDSIVGGFVPRVQPDLFESGESKECLAITADLLSAIQWTADCVSACLGGFNPSEWRAKHGPGAVADQRHTQFKYDFPNWPAKLDAIFPMADFAFANYNHWAMHLREKGFNGLTSHEPPSKLIAVPKTQKGPRLIASEPVAHQWCQQIVKDFLTCGLATTPIASSIHFRDQSYNQNAARAASHTGSHATIDLSAASDRISCWLVERIFRRNSSLLNALHATRTRWISNEIDRKSPQFHKLRKFSCMGSACTFPVQSYVFSIITIGTILHSRKLRWTMANLRRISQEVLVFGDDIVVPIDCWEVLQDVLGHLGLKVNLNKTFGTGKFRESCGVDAFDGTDVTPTYSMTYPDVSRPESIISAVATHNNFALRGYSAVMTYIRSIVSATRIKSVAEVPIGSGSFGWFSVDPSNRSLIQRWNGDLHQREVKCLMVSTKMTRQPVTRNSSVLQYFTEVTRPPDRNDDRIGRPTRPSLNLKLRWVNPNYLEN